MTEPLPPLPDPCLTAYIKGPQGGEYRALSDSYEPDCAMYSPEHMQLYAESARAPLQACIAELKAQLAWTRERLQVAEQKAEKLSAAETDTKRLDWLDQMNAALNARYGTTYGWKLVLSPMIVRLIADRGAGAGYVSAIDLNDANAFGASSCRLAIDDAREASK